MSNMQLYGYINKIMAEVNAHILKHPELGKFIKYTDNKYIEQSILDEPVVKASDLVNKNYFMYKRVPNAIEVAGVYLYVNIYRQTSFKIGSNIKEVVFTTDMLVHKDCLITVHGNRLICLVTAMEDALSSYVKKSAIGDIDLIRISPLLGVIKDYEGYSMQFRVYGFNDLK